MIRLQRAKMYLEPTAWGKTTEKQSSYKNPPKPYGKHGLARAQLRCDAGTGPSKARAGLRRAPAALSNPPGMEHVCRAAIRNPLLAARSPVSL